ncbi:MAG: 4Fe-4S dicluster domain-containing protein [Deltaproteobacteria bacterium]|nr:4Fe-4S dicluster domain-containing protein [Deltaproteobacteria bacterium]
MEWTPEAKAALQHVPFFVRKRVRARVEKEAVEAGKKGVALADVKATQARYLSGMHADIKGYQLDTCFGPSGCPNRAVASDPLLARVEMVIKAADLLSFLKSRVPGNLKFHHEFRVTLADCPNACSQPQIKDVGIIGAAVPETTNAACSQCQACVESCPEQAIAFAAEGRPPGIDTVRCLNCGRCIRACPTGTIAEAWRGFRVQLGGRLGRHPRLARELPGIFSEDQVIEILQDCLKLYKERSLHGERFSQLFQDRDFEEISRRFCAAAV